MAPLYFFIKYNACVAWTCFYGACDEPIVSVAKITAFGKGVVDRDPRWPEFRAVDNNRLYIAYMTLENRPPEL